MRDGMNTDLLKYILKNEAIPVEKALNMSPDNLLEKVKDFVGKLEDQTNLNEVVQILNDALVIIEEYNDTLLLWLTVMSLNGMLSAGALEVLTEISFTLLHEVNPVTPSIIDIDENSVFYSFSDKVLPELIERAAAIPTLFCFREKCAAPKKLKSMLNLCCVVGELNTFPDFDRYSVEIDIGQEYAADVIVGLRTLAQLAYMTTLLYITKGESKLGAIMARWAKAQLSYKQVYKNICSTLGIIDTNTNVMLN